MPQINNLPPRAVPLTGTEVFVLQDSNATTQRVTANQVKDFVESEMQQNYELLYVSTATVGTPASTVETTLASYTLPGGMLAVNGDFIEVRASGSFAANGNGKTIRIKFGGNLIISTAGQTPNNLNWELYIKIDRTDLAAQKIFGKIEATTIYTGFSALTAPTSLSIHATDTVDLSSNALIEITGQNSNANANDIVIQEVSIELKKPQ